MILPSYSSVFLLFSLPFCGKHNPKMLSYKKKREKRHIFFGKILTIALPCYIMDTINICSWAIF